MKHLLNALFVILLATSSAWADTAVGPMNYQGRLLDDNGVPLTGSYDFVARVYNASSGGTLKYQEGHNNVDVDDGVYSFLVGTQTKTGGDSTWSIELWNCCSDLYLEIAVEGETLSPRHRLAAAPYAFQATLALTTNNALALGGKTAAEYDNILADICVSGKGKWLELVEQCLGAGTTFDGTPVLWSTLSASSNFTGIDLTNADITGINFSGADLTGTTFKKTDYMVSNMSGATLRDTEWNSANATDVSAYVLSSSTILIGATLKNMDMSKWNLSSVPVANISKLSAADLSACPAALPANWQCKDELLAATNNFFLLGPGVDLSAGSAASSFKFGSSYLNLGKEALANSNLNGATFVGNVINQNFNNVDLTNTDFSYATITNSVFSGGSTRLIGSKFVNARVDRPVIQSGVVFDSVDFTEADINYVKFQQDILSGASFAGATLRGVGFAGLNNANFAGAVLDGVYIDGNHGTNNFTNVRFYNGFRHGQVSTATETYTGGSTFNNVVFIGGTLSGDFGDAIFTGATVFDTVTFSHLDLCHANIPLVDTTAPHDDLKTVTWVGPSECPNGTDVLSGGVACNQSTNWTFYTGGTCNTGIP